MASVHEGDLKMDKLKKFTKKHKSPLVVGAIGLFLLILTVPIAYNAGKDASVQENIALQNQNPFYEQFSDNPFIRMEQMSQRME